MKTNNELVMESVEHWERLRDGTRAEHESPIQTRRPS